MKIEIKEKLVLKVGEIATKYNFEVYVVGGFVRDSILQNESQDIDFVVVGDCFEFAEHLKKEFNLKKIVIYRRFQTVKLPIKKFSLEFVGAREEVYEEGSRNPIVKPATLESDLSRRDFTINALAARINGDNIGEVIDLFEGINDLENGIIKTPLDPNITYSDDPLRIMRAIRFASRYNYQIEKKSLSAIENVKDRIKIVSVERITDEFFKLLSSAYPTKGLRLLDETGLLALIFPELERLKGIESVQGVEHKDNFEHSLKVFDNVVQVSSDLKLRLAALMHDIAKPLVKKYIPKIGWTFHGHEDKGVSVFKKIASRLKWSNEIIDYVSKIIKLHHRPISLTCKDVSDSGVRRLLFEGGEHVEDLMILCKADITTGNKNKLNKYLNNYKILEEKIIDVEHKDHLRNFKPPLTGKDIMEEFQLSPGPEVGKIKKIIVDEILNGTLINSRLEAIAFLKNLKKDN